MARYVTLALHLVEQTEENLELLKKVRILCYEGEDAEDVEKLRDSAWETYNKAYELLNQWLDEAYTEKYSKEPDYTPLQGVMDGFYTDWTDLQLDYSTWDLTTPKKHELDAELLLAVDRLRREGIITGYTVTSSS